MISTFNNLQDRWWPSTNLERSAKESLMGRLKDSGIGTIRVTGEE